MEPLVRTFGQWMGLLARTFGRSVERSADRMAADTACASASRARGSGRWRRRRLYRPRV